MSPPSATTAAAGGNTTEEFDVVIVGAGLNGINTAYRLQTKMHEDKFAILA